tara:strand:+ start:2630 stop:3223 length:594 start_codon:yes stop_codon:yes gene_type:complete
MKKQKQKKIQILLVLIGSILILGTYFYYPNINKVKLIKKNAVEEDSLINEKNSESSTFVNVKYKGRYSSEPFTVESKTAYILTAEPDIVYMQDMLVLLQLNDKRVVEIKSDEGRYNKNTYDIFFEKNVEATDGDAKFLSQNLDLVATKNFAEIYNNVILNYDNGSLMADSVIYDFQTKVFTVSMYDEDIVRMKVKNE